MINPVNSEPNKKHKYQDPLNKKLPVIMSYSNEVGTAISEIAPKIGAALWAPTFMYLGADIYDKYKNDKNNYNPSGKRAFKRAVFQGLTSLVALPAVIFAAQNIVSPLGRIYKHGISGNTKDAIYKHTKDVIEQAHGRSLHSFEQFKDIIDKTLDNKIKARTNEKKTINIFKRLYNKIFTHRYDLISDEKAKVLAFAEKNAKKTFDILTALKKDDKKSVPRIVYKKYKKILPVMKEMYKDGDYAYQATRNALKEYQNSLIFKNKLLKTLGGFTALILFANPVNTFVDKKIMKKYIAPRIDQISNNFVDDSNMKNIFNNMNTQRFILENKNATTSNLIERLKNRHGLKSMAEESLSHTDRQQTSQ